MGEKAGALDRSSFVKLRRGLTWGLLGLGMSIAPAHAHAQAQPRQGDFNEFKHSRWTAEDGAPTGGITSIVQTPDGYLWMVASGVYRFDGVTFERIDPPADSAMERSVPNRLFVTRSGELLVAYTQGAGLAVYRNRRLRDVGMPNVPRTISRIAQTRDGTIWVASPNWTERLRRWVGGHWEPVDDRFGLPPGAVMALQAGPGGDLVVTLTNREGPDGRLAWLPPGATRFRLLPYSIASLARAVFSPAGDLWVADRRGTRMLLDGKRTVPAQPILFPSVPGMRSAFPVFDRSGGMWATTDSAGIFHIPTPRTAPRPPDSGVHQFNQTAGLTSDTTLEAFVDREGSIWIGTLLGLDQFRPASAVRESEIPADPVTGLSIAASNDGSVYVRSRQTIYHVAPGQRPRPFATMASGEAILCSARGGGLWIIRASGLERIQAGRTERFAGPPGNLAIGCTEDRQGRLWVGMDGGPLLWRDGNGWHRPGGTLGDTAIRDIISTSTGDMAFLTATGFGRVSANRLSTAMNDAYALGAPSMIAQGRKDLFIGGNNALLRVRGDRVARIDVRRAPWVARLVGLVQTARGETWLFSNEGVSQVATADLDRAFDDSRSPLARRRYDSNDGVTAPVQHPTFGGIQAVADGRDRIWFLHREGVSVIDPARLRTNDLPPPVAIASLASDGKTYTDPRDLVLPAGTRALDIAYAGLSFIVPQRVRFRYRLEGVDEDWVDPGTRRLASYANLGPGRYRFHVIAANGDGVWNDKGAMLEFEIPPTFLQSWPFRLLCGLVLLGLMWLIYSIRVRNLANRIRMRMAERLEERERIARELHDTLLQSVQSLTLRFQLAADDLPPQAAARTTLIDAIDRADQVIAEGRDRVRNLRLSRDGSDLRQIIAEIVEEQAFGPAVETVIVETGTPRALDALVLDEIVRIAREALFNIRRHADASRVEIGIDYQGRFTLRLADNGKGIDPRVAEEGGKEGHFGLSGMRERARKLEGEFRIGQPATGGTEIRLSLPGSVAYGNDPRRLFGRRLPPS